MKEYMKLFGQTVPVIGSVETAQFGAVPLLNIRLMSDERWGAMCREDFRRKYEKEYGVQGEFPERAYQEYCSEIRRQCEGLPCKAIPVVCYV